MQEDKKNHLGAAEGLEHDEVREEEIANEAVVMFCD